MKKIFLLIMLYVSLQSGATAQVTIQPGLPAVGMMQKDQLWNVLVINGTNGSLKCRLDVMLRDRTTGNECLSGTSVFFDVASGARQLNVNVLGPVQYNYFNAGFNNKIQGLIPAGNYTACYILYANIAGKVEPQAEECVSFDIEPLSPPMLSFPADSSVLDVAPNQFSWLPPTPVAMFDKLRYEILIVEINAGQQPAEALQENLPVYSEAFLYSNALNYPASSAAFQKNKWYAWQVVAKDDNNYAVKSEVWVFKVMNGSIQKIIDEAPFIKISKENTEVSIVHEGVLKIEYFNQPGDKKIDFKVYKASERGKNVEAITLSTDVKPGQNFIKYDLKSKLKLEENEVYEVEITNSRGEQWFIRLRSVFYDKK